MLAGVGLGMAVAALMALLSVTFKTEQVINGIVIVLLAGGATSLAYEKLFGVTTTPPRFDTLPSLKIPLLGSIPGIGAVLFDQNALVYLSILAVGVVWWVLYRTRFGLSVRAAGERPDAADAAGVNVDRIRWYALLVSGAMGGLGGAVLIVAQLGLFRDNITAGRGWVAIALVIFGRWSPLRVMAGALLFGGHRRLAAEDPGRGRRRRHRGPLRALPGPPLHSHHRRSRSGHRLGQRRRPAQGPGLPLRKGSRRPEMTETPRPRRKFLPLSLDAE